MTKAEAESILTSLIHKVFPMQAIELSVEKFELAMNYSLVKKEGWQNLLIPTIQNEGRHRLSTVYFLTTEKHTRHGNRQHRDD